MARYSVRFLTAMLLATSCATGAYAVDSLTPTGMSKDQPVMMTANEMGYDEPSATAVAIGHVEVIQGDSILFADKVTYNQNTDVVHATGHVSVMEPTGDVFFSDDAILKNKLQKGIVKQFRARLSDNSLFAAREGHKLNKDVTVMHDAVYSPCKVCAPKPGEDASAPLWQVKAETATVNEQTQRVTYHDAFMDVYGVPVLYTPYFSHPTPDAPSQSGLLIPQYFSASDLGSVVKEPIYVSFAPNTDATITPWYMSGEKPMLEGEFRHLTEGGFYTIRGAVTDTYNRDDLGNVIPGDEVRGYIEAHGKLQLSEHWDAGVDAERTTDDTFLQLYRFSYQNMLTSRAYVERIEDRDYAVVESMAFQGLQAVDIDSQTPYVLPQGNIHLESSTGAGGVANSRFTFDGNALALERETGDSDQRLSSTVGWKLPYITRGGQVFETDFTLRGDAYNVSDQVTNTVTNAQFNGDTGRIIPQADFNWRYPLINRFGGGTSLMITPIAEVVASPTIHNSSNIPNEDSQIAELSDTNLFSPDRYTGLDEVESGFRGTYGMRGQLQFSDKKYIEWLLGQAYQQSNDGDFPIATDPNANFSDYIGRLALKYEWVDLAYSFRLDRDSLSPTSNEITTNFDLKPLSFEINYISLQNEPLFGDRKEIFGSTALQLSSNWTWNVSGRRDLGSTEETPENPALPVSINNPLIAGDGTVGLNTNLVFHNECIMITTTLGRSYISEQDVRPSTTIGVMVTLKNFGSPTSSGSSANNITGAGNITNTLSGSAGGNTVGTMNTNTTAMTGSTP